MDPFADIIGSPGSVQPSAGDDPFSDIIGVKSAPRAMAAPTGPEPSATEALLRGAAQGATFEFGDEIAGLGKALFRAEGDPYRFKGEYRKGRDETRTANKRAEAAHPLAYTTGAFGGSVATSFVPGLGFAKGATGLKALVQAGKSGAVSGLGASEAEDLPGMAVDAAKSGALGAATFGLVNRFLKGAPSRTVQRTLGDITDGATANMRDRVVGQAGKRVDDVLDIVRNNPAIKKAGRDPNKIMVAIEDDIERTGAKLDGAYRSAGVRTEGIKVSNVLGEVEDIAKELAKDPGKRDLARAVMGKADDVLEVWGNQTHVTPQQVRVLASDIAEAAFRGSPAVSPKAGQAVSQQVWGRLKDMISSNMDESIKAGGTAGSAELNALNKRMSTLLNVREAVRYRATREATESTRLKDRISGGLDIGLALTSPTAFVAKKGFDYVGKPVLRALDDKLAAIVSAAERGDTKAQIVERGLALGLSPVVARSLASWAMGTLGGGAEVQQ